jgi:hypothetical protein
MKALLLMAVISMFNSNMLITKNFSSEKELLVIEAPGEVKLVTCKGSRVIVETEISTNFPKHIANAIMSRWTFKVHNDFAMGITRVKLLVDGKEVTYKNSSLEENFITTVYVPEDIQRVKILNK